MHPCVYFPNLIDYMRILNLVIAIFTAKNYKIFTIVLFTLSDLMDMVDGFLARYLN